MKRLIAISFWLLTSITSASSQIYYKRIIYVFNYMFEDANHHIIKDGELYLGCVGKEWALKDQQRQAYVKWATDRAELIKKGIAKREETGIYEEENLIWMHPPRLLWTEHSNSHKSLGERGGFAILEYSPWPQIRFPIANNKSWKRQFQPGANYVNESFGITADTVIEFVYTNHGKTAFYYNKVPINCWVIGAKSTNLKRNTSFDGLFNSELGFVRMVFRNIDQSVLSIELIRTEQW